MSKITLYIRFFLILGLVFTACNVDNPTPAPSSVAKGDSETNAQTLQGLYARAAEISSFVPCEMNEFPGPGNGYWLVPNDEFSQLHTLVNNEMMADIAGTYDPYDRFVIYVRFQGVLSPPTSGEMGSGYGPEGLYSREVKVTKALQAKYYWVGTTTDKVLRNPCP